MASWAWRGWVVGYVALASVAWPSAVRADASASASASASTADYAWEPTADGGVRAENDAQGYDVRVTSRGASVDVRDERGGLGLALRALGRGAQLASVGDAEATRHGARIERRLDGVIEWFAHGLAGLQQGFDIPTRPAGEGALVLEIAVRGRTPHLSREGEVRFEAPGVAPLHYRALRAWDARGRALSASMDVHADAIRLRVDDRDARYPIVVDPFVQAATLVADAPVAAAALGSAVAIEGDFAIVGAPADDTHGEDSGAVYVFVRDAPGMWRQEARLDAGSWSPGIRLGSSVSIWGDRILVGADGADSDRGAVYTFVRAGDGTWSAGPILRSSDGRGGDLFGTSVSISGTLALVGAIGDDDRGRDSGSAYLYSRNGANWSQLAKFTAPDGAAYDNFGRSVSLSGDLFIVGADGVDGPTANVGAVYAFVRQDAGNFIHDGTLRPGSATTADRFGRSVSLSGDRAVIGAFGDDTIAPDGGAAYVYVRTYPGGGAGGQWAQETKLTRIDSVASDGFGRSVSISCGRIVVGAPGFDGGASDAGGAFVFERDGGLWTETQAIRPWDAAPVDFGGRAVAIWGESILFGAPSRDGDVRDAGGAYVFTNASPDCGNGTLEVGEECDDADANSDETVDACRTSCRAPYCGDGVVDTGEDCDAGGEPSISCNRWCEAIDPALACGNGRIDEGETCDRGAANSPIEPDGCRLDCQPARCGDGVVDTGEECDGLPVDGQDCQSDCTLAPPPVEADAGVAGGGGSTAGGGSGCGCDVGAGVPRDAGTLAWMVALGLLAFALRRRRLA